MLEILEDEYGLYLNNGDDTAIRPFFGTCFIKGEKVKTYQIDGTSLYKVTIESFSFNFKHENYEYWGHADNVSGSKGDREKSLTFYGNRYPKGVYSEHNKKIGKILKNNELIISRLKETFKDDVITKHNRVLNYKQKIKSSTNACDKLLRQFMLDELKVANPDGTLLSFIGVNNGEIIYDYAFSTDICQIRRSLDTYAEYKYKNSKKS